MRWCIAGNGTLAMSAVEGITIKSGLRVWCRSDSCPPIPAKQEGKQQDKASRTISLLGEHSTVLRICFLPPDSNCIGNPSDSRPKRGDARLQARPSTRVRSANKTHGRGRLRISSVVTVRCRWWRNKEGTDCSVPLFCRESLRPTVKELLEGSVHNLSNAYSFKVCRSFDRCNVSLLHVVGLALGRSVFITRKTRRALPFPPPNKHCFQVIP